jgi:hypothetical protein
VKLRIVNARAQPVSLHLSGGVRVIEPLGDAVVDEAELAGQRQVKALADQRLIIVMEAEDAAGAEPAGEREPGAGTAGSRPPRRTSTTRRPAGPRPARKRTARERSG